jgi:hypothetical protein
MARGAEPFRARNVVLGALAIAAKGHALNLNYDSPPRSTVANMFISLTKPFEAFKRSMRVREKRSYEGGELEGISGLAIANDTGIWVVDSLYEGQDFYE